VEADVAKQKNADRILAQMTIRVQIPVSQDPSLLVIPESALQLSNKANTIWIVTPNVTAEAKEVEIAFIHKGYAYVLSGISKKEWVIVKSPVELTPGIAIDTKSL
jgi:multidrug efflux pump subunit AcrA (membrane-fusion protein)